MITVQSHDHTLATDPRRETQVLRRYDLLLWPSEWDTDAAREYRVVRALIPRRMTTAMVMVMAMAMKPTVGGPKLVLEWSSHTPAGA